MNIKEELRPLAILRINVNKHPERIIEVAAWLKKTADYLVENRTELSDKFMARMFRKKE